MIKENKKECLTFELCTYIPTSRTTQLPLCTIKSAMLTSYTEHAWLCLPRQDEHDSSGAEAEYDTEQATHLIIYSMVGTYPNIFSADRIWWLSKTWSIKYLLHHRGNLQRTLLLVSRKDSFVRHCPPSLLFSALLDISFLWSMSPAARPPQCDEETYWLTKRGGNSDQESLLCWLIVIRCIV